MVVSLERDPDDDYDYDHDVLHDSMHPAHNMGTAWQHGVPSSSPGRLQGHQQHRDSWHQLEFPNLSNVKSQSQQEIANLNKTDKVTSDKHSSLELLSFYLFLNEDESCVGLASHSA